MRLLTLDDVMVTYRCADGHEWNSMFCDILNGGFNLGPPYDMQCPRIVDGDRGIQCPHRAIADHDPRPDWARKQYPWIASDAGRRAFLAAHGIDAQGPLAFQDGPPLDDVRGLFE